MYHLLFVAPSCIIISKKKLMNLSRNSFLTPLKPIYPDHVTRQELGQHYRKYVNSTLAKRSPIHKLTTLKI